MPDGRTRRDWTAPAAPAAEIAARGAEVETVAGDVTDDTDRKRLIERAAARFGGIDVLVNNAGASVRDGSTEERWRGSFEINVLAAVRLTELAKAHLERAAGGEGAVV